MQILQCHKKFRAKLAIETKIANSFREELLPEAQIILLEI